jgi:hypothetical protein
MRKSETSKVAVKTVMARNQSASKRGTFQDTLEQPDPATTRPNKTLLRDRRATKRQKSRTSQPEAASEKNDKSASARPRAPSNQSKK